MWHLTDYANLERLEIDGKTIDLIRLDYRLIPKFLKQKDYDAQRANNLDRFAVSELYVYGSHGCTSSNHFSTEKLTILVNSSRKDKFNFAELHEIGHCVKDYHYDENESEYVRDFMLDASGNKEMYREYRADRYALDTIRENTGYSMRKIVNILIKNSKRYFKSLGNIYKNKVDESIILDTLRVEKGVDYNPDILSSKDFSNRDICLLCEWCKSLLTCARIDL